MTRLYSVIDKKTGHLMAEEISLCKKHSDWDGIGYQTILLRLTKKKPCRFCQEPSRAKVWLGR